MPGSGSLYLLCGSRGVSCLIWEGYSSVLSGISHNQEVILPSGLPALSSPTSIWSSISTGVSCSDMIASYAASKA
ncbi:hypothetical protein BJY04DRAFT_193193 [Aspergillus karnatakaensis]|uniref:uncharacterized protein n=1 Tax=Aspergillus karnatakaensis TaxID=1810916 RepID=UPI003CCD5385